MAHQFDKIIDLLLFLINKVDYYWNIFYIVNGSIITLLLINELKVHNLIIISLLTAIYIGFMIFSYFAHKRAYIFLNNIIIDLKSRSEISALFPSTYKKLRFLSYKKTMKSIPYIYCFVTLSIISFFWIVGYAW